jgi:hypothetical protein
MRKVATSNENLKTLCRQLVKIEINMAANSYQDKEEEKKGKLQLD